MINTKFENAFNDYMNESLDTNTRIESYKIMIDMWNNMEINKDEFQEKYEIIIPEMGDETLFNEVNVNTFLGE